MKKRNKKLSKSIIKRTWKRLSVSLLSICLIFSILSTSGLTSIIYAADEVNNGDGVTNNIVENSRIADPDTSDDYLNRLLSEDNGSRYAGRVWTDKSVFSYETLNNIDEDNDGVPDYGTSENHKEDGTYLLDMGTDGYDGQIDFDSDFLHEYSALASSQVVNEYPPSPIDLVIAFDMSGSMGQDTRFGIDTGRNIYVPHESSGDGTSKWPTYGVSMDDRIKNSRVQKTLDAINETIDKLMAQNSQNRVAVIGYGANATVLLPLAHYRHADGSNNYEANKESNPYLSVGGMETLYHPSDLVYWDDKSIVENFPDKENEMTPGWYWQNNRDTCYTIEVNASNECSTYTQPLTDEIGKKSWETLENRLDKRIISNNVLDNKGDPVKAFPGITDQNDEDSNTIKDESQKVYQGAKNTHDGTLTEEGKSYPAQSKELTNAMSKTEGLKADEYVGYFTNTQGGIYLAYKQLADSEVTTYTERLSNDEESTVARVPAAIIMSDGGANFAFNQMGMDAKPKQTVNEWESRYGQFTKKFNDIYIENNWDKILSIKIPGVGPNASGHIEFECSGSKRDLQALYKNHSYGIKKVNLEKESSNGNIKYTLDYTNEDSDSRDLEIAIPLYSGIEYVANTAKKDGANIDQDKISILNTFPEGIGPDSWYNTDDGWEGDNGHDLDYKHRLNENIGDEWYNVYLPGKDTLDHDESADSDNKGEGIWNGLHGIYNVGGDYYQDGTLTTQPAWSHAGVLYNSDNNPAGTAGTVLEVLLTASYMNTVVDKHYVQGWSDGGASAESQDKAKLSTYTMNVDSQHVPQWGRMRLYPTLDPTHYPLDDLDSEDASKKWYKKNDKFGTDQDLGQLNSDYHVTLDQIYSNVSQYWKDWKDPKTTKTKATICDFATQIIINSIDGTGHTYPGNGEGISVTDEEVVKNIAYNKEFYDIGSMDISGTFQNILTEILGNAFIPVSGSNDAGVNNSLTYQDPIGDYMEVKNQSITTTAHKDKGPTTYDMSLLLFGKMHGLVRTGIYDYKWNDQYMTNLGSPDGSFPPGWYYGKPGSGDANKDVYFGGSGEKPEEQGGKPLPTGVEIPKNAEEAWEEGWSYRLDFETFLDYVPITNIKFANPDDPKPSELGDQEKNTVYTLYRFAGNKKARNALYRNPIYGDVPEKLQEIWNEYDESGDYPKTNELYSTDENKGVYRLSDIRVWVENYGDFIDEEGRITPGKTNYDSSLYMNIPAAAVPTQLAEITLGPKGVASYETNLGSDYLKRFGQGFNEVTYKNYCAQSTPIRLFYSVGVDDDVMIEDGQNKTKRVDTSKLSTEYINSHTDSNNNIYFISNYYSKTEYGDYSTDQTNQDQGDPTVTFSPNKENRYYVYQKPLPLYAHAYRVKDDKFKAVDDVTKEEGWSSEDNKSGGNSTTEWENKNPGTWEGGQYMGTYNTKQSFQIKLKQAQETQDGFITDDHDTKYKVAKNESNQIDGIILLESDLLDHVKSEGDGYAEGSKAFKSDDYFFLIIDYYKPTPDFWGEKPDGTSLANEKIYGGEQVQWVVARQGSEFGSGFKNTNIDNGQMLCWTDMNHILDLELQYNSKTETTDPTRGEPTYAKLFGNDSEYQAELDQITDETQRDLIKAYWDKIRSSDEISNIKTKALADGNEINQDWFESTFKFAVAAKKGGIRTGNLRQNMQPKGGDLDEEGYRKNNYTQTANNYYVPTVSQNSNIEPNGNGLIIDNYLGNNGRLAIPNQKLLVTKTLEAPDKKELTEEQKNEEFNYQLYLEDIAGVKNAVKTFFNSYAQPDGVWQRTPGTIDVLTDNSGLLIDKNNQRVLFQFDGGGTGQLVVQKEDGFYLANPDGTASKNPAEGITNKNQLYYVYVPPNTEEGIDSDANSRRIYMDESLIPKGSHPLEQSGRTTYFAQSDRDPVEPGIGQLEAYQEEDEDHIAGTQTHWVLNAEIIPVKEVEAVEITSSDPAASPGGAVSPSVQTSVSQKWEHKEEGQDRHTKLSRLDILSIKPEAETSASKIITPYQTRTEYLTQEINFGIDVDKLSDDIIPTKDDPGFVKNLSERILGENAEAYANRINKNYIAPHTAEFTLKNGEGLLIMGLSGSDYYRFTEVLTSEQISKGYELKNVTHKQQVEGEIVYKPEIQDITVYTADGATYGANYGADRATDNNDYSNTPTQHGITWKDYPKAQESHEAFYHSNATVKQAYETYKGVSDRDDLDLYGGNHIAVNNVDNEIFKNDALGHIWRWDIYQDGKLLYPNNPKAHQITPQKNSLCRDEDDLVNLKEKFESSEKDPKEQPENTTVDIGQNDGSVRHYYYKDSQLIDAHYDGMPTVYLQDTSRYILSPTAHFKLDGEDQAFAETIPTPKDKIDLYKNPEYVGVYSIYGDTGKYEEQAHFVNTFVPGILSITKKLDSQENTKIRDQDRQKEFTFKLKLEGEILEKDFEYKLTNANGEITKGKLYPSTFDGDVTKPDIKAEAKNTWTFTLKADETLSVLKVPAGLQYTVTEVTEDGFASSSTDTQGNSDGDTITGIVGTDTEPILITFTNTKKDPEPVGTNLKLSKLFKKEEGTDESLPEGSFQFEVTPGGGNPKDDPIRSDKNWKSDQNKLIINGGTGSGEDQKEYQVNIFDENFQFSKAGVYTYYISESNTGIPGVNYDGRVYTVTYTVTEKYDDNNYLKRLEVTRTITPELSEEDNTNNNLPFENTYSKDKVSVQLKAQKFLLNMDETPSEGSKSDYEFELKYLGKDSLPKEVSAIFDDINSEEDLEEVIPEQDETVTDDSEDLVDEEKEIEPDTGIEVPGIEDFSNDLEREKLVNSYLELDKVQDFYENLPGNKILKDQEDINSNQITELNKLDYFVDKFDLSLFDDSLNDKDNQEISEDIPDVSPVDLEETDDSIKKPQSATSGNDGWAYFDKLVFTEAGTYYYLITETNSGKDGVEYDQATWLVTIVVTDPNNNDFLSAQITYRRAGDETSVNSQKAEFTNKVKSPHVVLQLLHKDKTNSFNQNLLHDLDKDGNNTVNYQIKVKNDGGLEATGIRLYNVIPNMLNPDEHLKSGYKVGNTPDDEEITLASVEEYNFNSETLVKAAALNWDEENGTKIITNPFNLNPGEEVSIEFSAKVNKDAPEGTYWQDHAYLTYDQLDQESHPKSCPQEAGYDTTDGKAYTLEVANKKYATQDGYYCKHNHFENTNYIDKIPNSEKTHHSDPGNGLNFKQDGKILSYKISDDVAERIAEEGKASLSVSKLVEGAAADIEKPFKFKITLSKNQSMNPPLEFNGNLNTIKSDGTEGDLIFENGVSKVFELKHNETLKVTDLPPDIYYYVEELKESSEGYNVQSTNEKDYIPEGSNHDCTYTNHRETDQEVGNLLIEKHVTGNKGEKNYPFNFTVTLDDTSINGKFGEATFTNGVAHFQLRDDEHIIIENLPIGTGYTVKEETVSGYRTSYSQNKGAIEAGNTSRGFITSAGHTEEEAFFNNQGEPKKEELTPGENQRVKVGDYIEYTIDWSNDQNKVASIVVTDKLDPGVDFESASFNGVTLNKGATGNRVTQNGITITYDSKNHTVTWNLGKQQKDTSGYVYLKVKVNNNARLSWNYNDNYDQTENNPGSETDNIVRNKAKVEIEHNPKFTVEIENPVDKTGNLTVSKKVDGEAGSSEQEFRFRVTLSQSLTGTYGDMTFTNGIAEFTLHHSQSKTATGLPDGVTYTVTELDANEGGYSTKATGDTGKIVENTTANAEFINTKNKEEPKKIETTPGDHRGVTLGELITYEITWKNYLDKEAEVVITDPLDPGVDFEAASYKGTKPGNASDPVYDPTTRTVNWKLGKQAAGASGVVILQVRVNKNAFYDWEYLKDSDDYPNMDTGHNDNMVYNRAKVTVDNKSDYTNIPENPVGEEPKKEEITPGDGEKVAVGQQITYKIEWSNYDTVPADVVITDVLDPGVKFVKAYYDNGTPQGDEAVCENDVVTWTLKNQPAGAKGTVILVVEVTEKALEDEGLVENEAGVKVGNHDEVKTNKQDNPTDKEEPHKTEVTPGDTEQVQVGDLITYKIIWNDNQPDTSNISIRDPLDKGVTFVSANFGNSINPQQSEEDKVISSEDNNLNYENAGYKLSYNPDEHTVYWTIPQRPEGSTGFVYLTVQVNEEANVLKHVDNTAWVQVGNQPEQETETVTNPLESPRIKIEKYHRKVNRPWTVADHLNEVGETISYRLIVRSTGKVTARNVRLTDLLPETIKPIAGTFTLQKYNNNTPLGSNVVPVQSSYGNNKDSLLWNLGDMNQGDWYDITFDFKQPQDNPDTWWVNHATVTYDNILDDEDIVAAGIKSPADQFTAQGTGDQAEIQTLGSVQNGLVHDRLALSGIENKKYYHSDEPDGSEIVKFSADVRETILDSEYEPEKEEITPGAGEQVGVGEQITYQIHYRNNQTKEGTVTIVDPLDVGLDYVYASDGGKYDPDGVLPDNLSVGYDYHGVVTWTINNVPAGSEGVVTLIVRVNPAALGAGEVLNEAFVKDPSNVWKETDEIENPTDEDHKEEVNPGDGVGVPVGKLITYDITYTNHTDHVSNVTIYDPVDVGLTYKSSTNGGIYTEGATLPSGAPIPNYSYHGVVQWVIPDVEPGESGVVSVTLEVNENIVNTGEVQNQADIQVDNDWTQTEEPDNPYNENQHKIETTPGDGYGVHVGDRITYEIDYFNYTEETSDVTVVDPLDVGLTYSSSDPAGTYNPNGVLPDNLTVDYNYHGVIEWTIPSVPAQTGGKITLTVTVNEDAVPTDIVKNQAFVKVGNNPWDATDEPENPLGEPKIDIEKEQATFKPDGTPDVARTKEYIEFTPGDHVTYYLTVTNTGDVPAHNIVITDPLPPGLTIIPGSATSGVTIENGQLIWHYDFLDVGESYTIEVSFTCQLPQIVTEKIYFRNIGYVDWDENPSENPKPSNEVVIGDPPADTTETPGTPDTPSSNNPGNPQVIRNVKTTVVKSSTGSPKTGVDNLIIPVLFGLIGICILVLLIQVYLQTRKARRDE